MTRRRQDRPRPRALPAPRPAQAARDAYQPAESTRLLTCTRPDCGANYLDDGPGKAAHKAVFGHAPRAPKGGR